MPARKAKPWTVRDDLETLRLGLLAAFASADDAVKAQIAGQLRQVVKDLAALGEPEGKSVADEIAARRAAKAKSAAPAKRRSQSRRSSGHNRTG